MSGGQIWDKTGAREALGLYTYWRHAPWSELINDRPTSPSARHRRWCTEILKDCVCILVGLRPLAHLYHFRTETTGHGVVMAVNQMVLKQDEDTSNRYRVIETLWHTPLNAYSGGKLPG